MSLKQVFVTALLVLALGAATLSFAGAAPRGGNCQTWFMDASVVSLQHAGCEERPSGVWQAAPGRCAKLVRQLYRRGYRAAEVDRIAHQRMCDFNGDFWEGFTIAV